MTARNWDGMNRRSITCETAFGRSKQLHDYTGRHRDIWTDEQGQATFVIPSNALQSGQSYLCFSRPGYGAAFDLRPRPTSQASFGADDLDIPSLRNGVVSIGRVHTGRGSRVRATLDPAGHAWVLGASILLEVVEPAGRVSGRQTIAHGKAARALEVSAIPAGWHMFRATASGLADAIPYELVLAYNGSQLQEGVLPCPHTA